MLFNKVDSLSANGQDQSSTIRDMAQVVEFSHGVECKVVVLLVIGHFADVVLVLQKESLLIEYNPVGIEILRLEMVQSRDIFIELDIVDGYARTFESIFDQLFCGFLVLFHLEEPLFLPVVFARVNSNLLR